MERELEEETRGEEAKTPVKRSEYPPGIFASQQPVNRDRDRESEKSPPHRRDEPRPDYNAPSLETRP